MKPVLLIIGVCVIILLLGAVMEGITEFRAAEYTEPHNVTTGAGQTSANVTLSQELYQDSTAYAEITSNVTADAAVPFSYVAATKSLLITGLLENQSRQLSVVYRYNQLEDYWAIDLLSKTWPLFIGLGILGIIVGAVILATRRE